MRNALARLFVLFSILLIGWSNAAHSRSSNSDTGDKLVKFACNKEILIVGESAHSDGGTLAFKSKILPKLVNECGYKAIIFEASYLDFEKINQITKPNENYDRSLFLSAWGGNWNQYSEVSTFADFIGSQSPNKLKIFGMDFQIGSRDAFYSMGAMSDELGDVIIGSDGEKCKSLLNPENRTWVDDMPLKAPIDDCLAKVIYGLGQRTDSGAVFLRKIANAYRKGNQYIGLSRDALNDLRDYNMANQIIEIKNSLPKGTKIIIWTANAHAALGGLYKGRSLAQVLKAKLGKSVFSIGITAASGSLAWHADNADEKINPKPGSLESYYKPGGEFSILNKSELQSLGKIDGQVLLGHEHQTKDWSKLFDSIVILKTEFPATSVDKNWISWKNMSKKELGK